MHENDFELTAPDFTEVAACALILTDRASVQCTSDSIETMAVSELSLDEIHEYLLGRGGRVKNSDIVKHFKKYLTHPESKNDARIKFKQYINTLATSRTEGDEKFVILRSKYANGLNVSHPSPISSPVHLPQNTLGLPAPNTIPPPLLTPSPKSRQPPPYRPPPPVTSPTPSLSPSLDNISLCSSSMSMKEPEDAPPQAPPRRKSQSRTPSTEIEPQEQQQQAQKDLGQSESTEHIISVKERTQKFNRLASVDNDLSPQPQKDKRRLHDTGADEDDGASVTPDAKRTEWIVASARADYQALAKLASINPRLVKTKDPFTAYTALHWAAKHGNSDIVKLMAGTYKCDVNARTNGGYTPMHIAMLHGHKDVFTLLADVYGGDAKLRDWNGRTPMYYLRTQNCDSRKDSYLKLKIHKKSSEKDLGFLRIGSLNVRVKKTTEAFSNFLGVGNSGGIAPIDPTLEKVHKSWGSADNVFKDNEMAAPKHIPSSKRKLKQSQDHVTSHSTPSTPNQKRSASAQHHPDSDSDTACGFDSNWKN